MIIALNNIKPSLNVKYDAIESGRNNNNKSVENSKNTNELNKMAYINRTLVNFCAYKKPEKVYPKHTQDNYTGCLVGGAIGDAMGNPVEFQTMDKIVETYGRKGITDFLLDKNGIAKFTEDTQLTMFTADGVIKSAIKTGNDESMPDMRDIYASYQDWLKTQKGKFKPTQNGWISNIEDLHSKRGYRLMCTEALETGFPGSMEFPINYSKSADGIMRTAPIGLKLYKNPELAFEAGARCAALTNGSPSAYLPAGLYAAIIANIVQGKEMNDAVDDSVKILKKYRGHEDTLKLIENARKLADSHVIEKTAIKRIGVGWNADEAIAVGVYCALKSPEDYKRAVLAAVNHDGASDTTAGIAGGLVGTYVGELKIPDEWKYRVELCSELDELSRDLFKNASEIENANEKYPVVKTKKKRIGIDY